MVFTVKGISEVSVVCWTAWRYRRLILLLSFCRVTELATRIDALLWERNLKSTAMLRFQLVSQVTPLLVMVNQAFPPPSDTVFRNSSERRQGGWTLAEGMMLLKKGRMAAVPSRRLRCGRTLHTITWNPCCSLSRPVSACQAVLPTAWSVPTLLFIVRWCRATWGGWHLEALGKKHNSPNYFLLSYIKKIKCVLLTT